MFQPLLVSHGCYGNIAWTWCEVRVCPSQKEAVGSEEKTLHDSKVKKDPGWDVDPGAQSYQLAPHRIYVLGISVIT